MLLLKTVIKVVIENSHKGSIENATYKITADEETLAKVYDARDAISKHCCENGNIIGLTHGQPRSFNENTFFDWHQAEDCLMLAVSDNSQGGTLTATLLQLRLQPAKICEDFIKPRALSPRP